MRTNHGPHRREGAMLRGSGLPGTRRSFLAASGLGAAALLASGLRVPARAALVADPWAQADAIVARIGASEPTFPDEDFPITDYGAVGDGNADCTAAIAAAIAACSEAGGGRVVVPAGIFLTGAVHLLSNVNLYVAQGATLRFSTDPGKYLPVVPTSWAGNDCFNYSPLIYAYQQHQHRRHRRGHARRPGPGVVAVARQARVGLAPGHAEGGARQPEAARPGRGGCAAGAAGVRRRPLAAADTSSSPTAAPTC